MAMTWKSNTWSYRGETSDGKIVDVTGDEYGEAFSDGLELLTGYADSDDIPEYLVEQYAPEVYAEIDDPNTWAALVGENQNVEFVEG